MANDATKIAKWFGNHLWYKEVNEDGTDLGTPDTWHPLGHLDAGEFKREPSNDDIEAENGEEIISLLDKDTPIFSGNVLQTDKNTVQFLSVGCRGKFYAILRDIGIVGGKQQAIVAPITRFTPKINLVAGTRKPSYEIKVRKNNTAITIPSAELTPLIPEITTNVTIGAKEQYYFFEET